MSDGIPFFRSSTAKYFPFPEDGGDPFPAGMDGKYSEIYRSADGCRFAGSFKESGKERTVMPYDEFVCILAGEAHITVEGVGEVHMKPGDACYLKEGWNVEFDLSEDFTDVTVLITDRGIAF